MSAGIETPCINICSLDAGRRHCLGCGRTLEEIARWRAMSAAERSAVMAELPGRRAARTPLAAGDAE